MRGAGEEAARSRGGDARIDLVESLCHDDHGADRRVDARAVEQHAADAAQHAGRGGKPSAGVERRRHRHRAREIDAIMGRPQAVDAAERGGYTDRAAGVAAERKALQALRTVAAAELLDEAAVVGYSSRRSQIGAARHNAH